MSELSTVAGNFAPTKYQIKHDGKTYHFRQVDGVVLKEWETARFNSALESLDALKDRLSESTFEKRCMEVVGRKEQGEYCFESKPSQDYLKTPPGMMLLLRLVTACDVSELVRLKNAKGAQVDALLTTILRESFGIKESKPKPIRKDKPATAVEPEAPLG